MKLCRVGRKFQSFSMCIHWNVSNAGAISLAVLVILDSALNDMGGWGL